MHFALAFVMLLETASITSAVDYSIIMSIQDDIRNQNASCQPYDTCKEGRTDDQMYRYSCQCSSVCLFHGTCCIDSSYVHLDPPKVRPTCKSINGMTFHYMVDHCPKSVSENSVWESLCHDEWNGEDGEVDIMKIVPVTSFFTRITYRNYFCFRCNEAGDDFLYWDVELGSSDYEFDQSIDKSKVSLSYDTTYRTWVAPLGNGGILIPVNVSIKTPGQIYSLLETCQPDVISRCADTWNDTDVRNKCDVYMAIIYIRDTDFNSVSYKNIHCALCNFEDLSNKYCGGGRGGGYGGKMPFSFTHLLDVNRSDGDEVGKIQKCENNFLWDPYAKKCRKLTCALPGYVVKNGKCTPP